LTDNINIHSADKVWHRKKQMAHFESLILFLMSKNNVTVDAIDIECFLLTSSVPPYRIFDTPKGGSFSKSEVCIKPHKGAVPTICETAP